MNSRYGKVKYDNQRGLYYHDVDDDIPTQLGIIPLLLQAGVNASLVNKQGKRAADYACNSDVKRLLSELK